MRLWQTHQGRSTASRATPPELHHANINFSSQTCVVLQLFSPGHQNTLVYLTRLLKDGCQELHPQDGTSTAGSSTLFADTRTLMTLCSVFNPPGHQVHLTAPQWGRHLASWGCCRMRTFFFFFSAAISSDHASHWHAAPAPTEGYWCSLQVCPPKLHKQYAGNKARYNIVPSFSILNLVIKKYIYWPLY